MYKGSAGQSLIEVLIALAITAIVILALAVVSLMSLKNAQFAQNQSKVTKYAQEAIDQVKTIRNRNGTVNFTYGAGGSDKTTTFSELWGVNMSGFCGGACYLNLNSVSPYSLSGSYGNPAAVDSIGEGFIRQIIFEDSSPLVFQEEKRITVKIKWTDGTGSHESNIQTILTKL